MEARAGTHPGVLVNDVHARLNPTRVRRIHRPASTEDVCALVRGARRRGSCLCIAGGRHAMGGQQFAAGAELIDTVALSRVLSLDADRGHLRVQSGVMWPQLLRDAAAAQGPRPRWGIAQKQTGADRMTIGGSLASNIHGRALDMPPFVADVESFVLVGPDAEPRTCSRTENPELFRLAIGGYGLFGVVTEVTLRLAPRRRVRRAVRLIDADEVVPAMEGRRDAGFLYGDFQFSIDPSSDGFLRRGILSCYEPVEDGAHPSPRTRELSPADWRRLIEFAHRDKARAFEEYAAHYLATDGQLSWSDDHQLAEYLDGYHLDLDRRLGALCPGSELITELYVPRPELPSLMRDSADLLRRRGADVIYGTVRLIRRDDETFLTWARDDWACLVLNLHVDHAPGPLARARDDFRALIDLALARRGSFYLTYHRFATRDQLLAAYPRFPEFLGAKRRHDPDGLFTSDWHRHAEALLRT